MSAAERETTIKFARELAAARGGPKVAKAAKKPKRKRRTKAEMEAARAEEAAFKAAE